MKGRRPPAEGERNALAGYIPQYRVAAGLILRALHTGSLVSITLVDPAADRLDDIQIETADQIDAYQVKWSRNSKRVGLGAFRALLRVLINGRGAIGARYEKRVVAHLHTNRLPSPAPLRNQLPDVRGLSLANFVSDVWTPASHGAFRLLDELPQSWRPFLTDLADSVGLSADELLQLAPSLSFEFDQRRPDKDVPRDREGELYLADLHAVTRALFDLVLDADDGAVRLETQELLSEIGGDWIDRGRFRAGGAFHAPVDYGEITASAEALQSALASITKGYLFVFGSPGSGKSTLLTQLLRTDPRLVASYYAYVRGDNTPTRSEASTFLHDVVLALEQAGFRHGKTLPPFGEVELLQERLAAQLRDIAEHARTGRGVAVILIDGLDHVERDPKPQRSLLDFLPDPASLPDGVIIVVGTRSRGDLPTHVRPAARDVRRVIDVARLSRQAVLALATRRGLSDVAEEIWRLSTGHPLLMWSFIRLAEACSERERAARLAGFAPTEEPEVGWLYEQTWSDIENEDELVELLALVARVRVPFRLSWLEETGTPPTVIRKLERFPHLIETDDYGRSLFFHDSFRVFVQQRTGERFGQPDEVRERGFHRNLADRCAAADPTEAVAWEELYHRLAAGEHAAVLDRATPLFFRAQLEALRPTRDVARAVREAAAALAHEHDANAVVRLAMAAMEVRSRDYSLPRSTDFLIALAELGKADVALAQLDDIRDNVVGNDRRASALRFALHLHDAGHEKTARRVFDAYEPLELLGGPGSPGRQPPDGPWEALRAWARAAAALRSPEYVIERLAQLDLSSTQVDDATTEETLRDVTLHLLLTAARSAADRGRDPASLLDEATDITSRHGVVSPDLMSFELSRTEDAELRGVLQSRLAALDLTDAHGTVGLDVVEVLWHSGNHVAAAEKLDQLAQPATPQSGSLRGDDRSWRDLYRYFRMRSAVGETLDPVAAIRAADSTHGEDAVYVARHLVALAAIDGAHLRDGEAPAAELVRVVESTLSFWDGRGPTIGMSGLRAVRSIYVEYAIRAAARIGGDAEERLFQLFERRWQERPYRLRDDGWKVLREFRRAGIGDVTLGRLLEKIDAWDDLDGDRLVEQACAWLTLERQDRADRALEQAVAGSFTVGYRKDYQLSEWIPLLSTILTGAEDASLAGWLAERLVALDDELEGGATLDAGRTLVALVGETSLATAYDVASILLRGGVFETDDVVATLLDAAAQRPSDAWWVVLRELLVAIGAGPPDALPAAVSATPAGPRRLEQLRETLDRVSVEGRPSQRVRWRIAIRDAAAASGLTEAAIGLDPADLDYSDESPSPEWGHETPSDDPDTRTFEELLEAVESGDDDYRARSALRHAVAGAPEDLTQRATRALAGTDDEPRLLAAIAEARLARVDEDGAWAAAVEALNKGSGRDWSRSWEGAVLRALAVMGSIDPERTRGLMFERFAAVASGDEFLLEEVGRDVSRVRELFAPLDETTLARDALSYLEALLGPQPEHAGEAGRAMAGGRANVDDAAIYRALIIELMTSPFTRAWTTGQRAALEFQRRGSRSDLLSELVASAVPPERVLTVVEAEAREGRNLDPDVVSYVESVAQDARLDLRDAARGILELAGVPSPETPHRPLPPGLTLELPQRIGTSATSVGARQRIVDELLEYHEGGLRRLAISADVDADALREHVTLKALRHPEASNIGDGRSHRVFGWAYVRPQAVAVVAALAETAGELVDADRLSAEEAGALAHIGAPYDVYYLLKRPQRRPSAVAAATPEKEREPWYQDDWLARLETAESRLAKAVGDALVVGEKTVLRLLTRQLTEETRVQALTATASASTPSIGLDATAFDLGRQPPVFDGRLILGGAWWPMNPEPEWITLHPEAAQAAGLTRDPHDPLAWLLDGERAVSSLWWRSGFARWDPSSPHDEVGEGWLVLATSEAVAALRRAIPEIAIAWEVQRKWRPRENDEVADSRSGSRAV